MFFVIDSVANIEEIRIITYIPVIMIFDNNIGKIAITPKKIRIVFKSNSIKKYTKEIVKTDSPNRLASIFFFKNNGVRSNSKYAK